MTSALATLCNTILCLSNAKIALNLLKTSVSLHHVILHRLLAHELQVQNFSIVLFGATCAELSPDSQLRLLQCDLQLGSRSKSIFKPLFIAGVW